jgi:hypothetical protein
MMMLLALRKPELLLRLLLPQVRLRLELLLSF